VTAAFLQHSHNERPQEATLLWECPSAGGVSHLAHRTRPRHLRVDPDAWLVPLDQKGSLRHVGRDGCVDVDLATYSLGPETGRMERPLPGGSAASPVCRLAPGPGGQAASRSPAWSARRWLWTTLCSSSEQEALAAPRRASARRGRQSPTAASLGGGSLISSFTRQLSQALARHASNVRESCCLPASERYRGIRSNLLRGQPLRLLAHACSSHTAFFSRVSAFPGSISAVSMSLLRLQ
jgi:hypothetical protein